jgi:ribokinase
MLANLKAVSVNTAGVVRRKDVASGTAMIVLDASGQNQIVVANGANDTLTAADVQGCQQQIRRSDALVVQLETSPESVRAALETAHECGTMTVLNPAPFSAVDDDLLQLCHVIIPNENEASHLSGITVQDLASAGEAARIIRARAPAAVVLVTLGPKGVWLDTPDFVGHVPGFPVAAVDTVGAGDTFIGAYVVRLVEKAGAREAARFGCAAAAIAVTRRGAQASIPDRAEVEAWLANRTRP